MSQIIKCFLCGKKIKVNCGGIYCRDSDSGLKKDTCSYKANIMKHKLYIKNNRELVNKINRERYQSNKTEKYSHIKVINKKWKEKNKDKIKIYKKRYEDKIKTICQNLTLIQNTSQ